MRIVLAEDSVLLRAGLTEVLQRGGHSVVAAVADGDALLAAVDLERPDLVITDVRMPPDFTDEGLRAAVQLRSRWPGQPILVLSQYVAASYAGRLFETHDGGGLGYLLKDRIGDVNEFLDAVIRVRRGGVAVDPDVIRAMVSSRRTADTLSALTPREREVLTRIAEGLNNSEIAARLVLSETAVTKHIGNVFVKLNLAPGDGNRRVLAVLAHLRASSG